MPSFRSAPRRVSSRMEIRDCQLLQCCGLVRELPGG